MPIKHAFNSAKSDPGDTTLVKPSDWNASHNAPIYVVPFLAQLGQAATTNIAAGVNELLTTNNRYRTALDLTYADQVRITASVVTTGNSGSKLAFQYSTDSGATWNYMDGVSGPSVGIDTGGLRVGSWVSLAVGAKADVWIRLVTVDGDGAADPGFGLVTLQYK